MPAPCGSAPGDRPVRRRRHDRSSSGVQRAASGRGPAPGRAEGPPRGDHRAGRDHTRCGDLVPADPDRGERRRGDAAFDRGGVRGRARDHERRLPVLAADLERRVVLRVRPRLARRAGRLRHRVAVPRVLPGLRRAGPDPVRRDAERDHPGARRAGHPVVAADLIGLVLIWGVAVLGIPLSVRSDLALLTFELGVLLALALTILVKGAPGGDWHPHVFSPGASPAGFSGVVVGAVFGVLAFTGFEAPAYLGEEAENPRRTIPRAILLTTVLIGVAFVFFFYVTTVGWGIPDIGKLPADPTPWGTLGRTYWGAGPTILIDIASVVALIAGALAAQNGAARMLFALGRDGLLPRALGGTLRRFGTPVTALT